VPHIADLQTKQNGAATYFAEQQNLARIVYSSYLYNCMFPSLDKEHLCDGVEIQCEATEKQAKLIQIFGENRHRLKEKHALYKQNESVHRQKHFKTNTVYEEKTGAKR